MPSIHDMFVGQVEAFLEETGTKPATFGWEALKDPNFVFEIRETRSCSARTMDKVLAYIEARRPEKKRKAS